MNKFKAPKNNKDLRANIVEVAAVRQANR